MGEPCDVRRDQRNRFVAIPSSRLFSGLNATTTSSFNSIEGDTNELSRAHKGIFGVAVSQNKRGTVLIVPKKWKCLDFQHGIRLAGLG